MDGGATGPAAVPGDPQGADRREGRGRLSSIDLLPDEATPDVIWALEQLRERKLPQNAILAEFNLRLADKGLEPVSKSAWSRYAVRKAIQFRKHDEARAVATNAVSPEVATQNADYLRQMVKAEPQAPKAAPAIGPGVWVTNISTGSIVPRAGSAPKYLSTFASMSAVLKSPVMTTVALFGP